MKAASVMLVVAVVVALSTGSASHAEDEANGCAASVPELRRLALEAATFRDSIVAALPPDLREADPDLIEEAFGDATALKSPATVAVADTYVAMVQLRDPLARYATQVAAAALAAEACAGEQ